MSIDDKVCGLGPLDVALSLTMGLAISAVMLYRSWPAIQEGIFATETAQQYQCAPKKKSIDFESEEVYRLASYFLRKKGRPEKYSEIKKMDSNNDDEITEQEVLNYVRTK